MLSNPRTQTSAVQLFTAAVAGPLLIVGAVQSSGSALTRGSMILTGVALMYWNTTALRRGAQNLLEAPQQS